MAAYLSRPGDSVGPYPAIIVIHEVWGLNEQIKGVTRRYANEGFAAIAPNLFTRHSDLLTEKNIARRSLSSCGHFKYHLKAAEFVTVRVVTIIKRRGWMSR